jgi:hypothetical protein
METHHIHTETPQTTTSDSNSKIFLDYLDEPADIEKAIMHGRCQKSNKIISSELDGKP